MKKPFAMLSTVILAGSLIGAPAASASTQDALTQRVQNMQQNDFYDYGFLDEKEPNNSFAEANLLDRDDTALGKLTDKDKDYYKVVIEADKEVFLLVNAYTDEEKPSMQLHVDIYNSSKKKIAPDFEDNEYGYGGIIEALAPGTYYFAVSDLANKNNGVEYYFSAYASTGEPEITRIQGADRYETAVEIAKEGFEEGNTPEVVLATGLDFPDALAGAPLAYQKDTPILLTKTKSIPDSVKKALTYFGVEHVTILGGQTAVSKDVETQLKKMNITFERIAGENRYDTAAKIAGELDPYFSDTAFVTYGGNFPDALSVASIAAFQGSPILLTKTKELPAETAKALKNYNDTYAIGGTSVISDAVYKKLPNRKRIAGADRYETSVQVIKQLDVPVDFATLATGQGFADALTGSVLAANRFEPVVLTKKDSLPDPVANLFQDKETMFYTILGGKSAVGQGVEDDIKMLFE
ncbi:cell wall-binding repeat-containing protein [Bacillus sp. NTK071]|uniref:cell wall-binding repeat-containing protein n=1 Tax=Bacillus sp. NTK071 TaxID=2802175 RepID=UPI001A8DED38|nr:cell wall-binding repeat-containing protein [Bacillus sp. NTK071]MBN8210258.1 cell wall-binding repeat-containing protein [Bacillus sp. NTK071]